MSNVSGWSLPRPPLQILKDAALLLDFDGTLVSIAERPDVVRVDAALDALLRRLHQNLHGRLGVVSGRPAGEVRNLLPNHDIVIAGSHGFEILWPDGREHLLAQPLETAGFLRDLRDLQSVYPGVMIEEKPFGAAIHYRMAPKAEEACLQRALELAQREELCLQPGKMVIELKPCGANKGSAIKTLMQDKAFSSAAPIFIGDDDTDEPGFSVAARLGGGGILVGAPRRTAARYRLEDVEDVRAWLGAAV